MAQNDSSLAPKLQGFVSNLVEACRTLAFVAIIRSAWGTVDKETLIMRMYSAVAVNCTVAPLGPTLAVGGATEIPLKL
jgi:hypothetical protein